MKRRLLNLAMLLSLMLGASVLLLMGVGAVFGPGSHSWETHSVRYTLCFDWDHLTLDRWDKLPVDWARVRHHNVSVHPRNRGIWHEWENTYYTDEGSYRLWHADTSMPLVVLLVLSAILPGCWAWRRLRRNGCVIYFSVPALGAVAALAVMYVVLVVLPLISRGAVDESTVAGKSAIWGSGFMAAILVGLKRWRALRQRRRSEQGLCLHCGYDLRASIERCPECGTPILQGA